jgi:uncharacterized protein (TIGR04255 family)
MNSPMASSDTLPQFDEPPVVETVLGVQFPAVELTNALAGWYWKSALGPEWSNAREAPEIPDAAELFGAERQWMTSPSIKVIPGITPSRLQIFRRDEERLIQVQNTRFIYNWKKAAGRPYPSYRALLPEFLQHFDQFAKFVQRESLGSVEPNQWEVAYVNHLHRGVLWTVLEDLHRTFPAFRPLVPSLPSDNFSGNWVSLISDDQSRKRGRLYVEMKRGKADSDEIIRLQLTARGPATVDFKLREGFDLGHATIVRSFAEMTSPEAHTHWKRSR